MQMQQLPSPSYKATASQEEVQRGHAPPAISRIYFILDFKRIIVL